MRTIDEIKDLMAADLMQNETAANKFGYTVGDKFTDHFSKVSIINILFYIVASAVWLLEKIFDTYQKEISHQIEEILPHRAKWYRDKVLHFMKGVCLKPESDQFDTKDMTEEEIEASFVVKHAVATELRDLSILQIKVAGEVKEQIDDEEVIRRVPLDGKTERKLIKYLEEIKDAGVHIQVVNKEPDLFKCEALIYYNPMLSKETVEKACRKTIINYIENIPFDGEYTNIELTNTLQAVEGVKIVYFKSVKTKGAEESGFNEIFARDTPYAGYYKADEILLLMEPYEQLMESEKENIWTNMTSKSGN